MGRSHRKVWEGKKCVLCGGKRNAEDCEHAPPKCMFLGQPRPKGFEFPACKRCNKGSSQIDQLAAFIAYSQAPDAVHRSSPLTSDQKKLIEGFGRNYPFPYEESQSVPVYVESSKSWTTARHVVLTDRAAQDIALWSAKQSLAMWYENMGKIVLHNAIIDIELLTNSMPPDIELERVIRKLGPTLSLSTKRNFVGENFSYKYQASNEKNLAAMFAQYHGGFAFVGIINDKRVARLSRNGLQFKFATNAFRGIHKV